MRKFLGAGIGVIAYAALLAPTAGAVPSGDTCAATGDGTAYTLNITLPPNAPDQTGFAFGAPNVKVTKVTIATTSGGGGGSQGGGFTTESLPANTTAAWRLGTPAAVPGSTISANLTTSGPVQGSFTVVPMHPQAPNVYFDPIVCVLAKPNLVSNKFTAQKRATYHAATGAWHVLVTIPDRGTLIFVHKTLARKGTPGPFIQSGRVAAKSGGKYRLALKPTAAGRAALKEKGSMEVSLNIQYSPRGGKPANKVVNLNLKR
jgi:hypothetical protein